MKIIVRSFLLFSAFYFFLFLVNCRQMQVFAQDANVPKIFCTEQEFDFGKINEGIEVKHVFTIINKGAKKLVLKTAYSTCGCTVPKIKQREIEPGKTAELEVLMDTSMKQGEVCKPIEVRSNDPLNPSMTIYVKANVRSPHADLGTDKTAKIFTGRCAACHVEKGKGCTGERLFFADCAMCHGFSARGVKGVAPALIPFDYQNKEFALVMRTIIAKGSKTHRSMPGFAKEVGGPLTDEEIDSLINYLKSKSEKERSIPK